MPSNFGNNRSFYSSRT